VNGRAVSRPRGNQEWFAWAALAAIVVGIPLLAGRFEIQLATKLAIWAIFAMSLDLLVGVTGIISLGHAAFYGVAAYVLVLAAPAAGAPDLLASLGMSIGAAALVALIIGLLSLRCTGVYLIMVTLALGQLVYFVFHDTSVGGGSDGIYMNTKPALELAGRTIIDLDNVVVFYAFCMALALGTYAILRRLAASPLGRALTGIRINEHRMQAIGFATYAYRVAAFTVAGALAGLAGYLNACQFGFVSPELLSWHVSGLVLVMVILGGKGRFRGAVLGALIVIGLEEILSNDAWLGAAAKHWQLWMGLIIVAAVLYGPGKANRFLTAVRRG